MNIPRVIKWGFNPNESSLEALRDPQDRVLWSVLRFGHIVDQHFNGRVADLGHNLRRFPPADVQDLINRAHRFGLHGYGVKAGAHTPFVADPEWWGELLDAWRGNLTIPNEVTA